MTKKEAQELFYRKTSQEIMDLVESAGGDVECVVAVGDVSWCVAPYANFWLAWDDADAFPHVEVFYTRGEAIQFHLDGARAGGYEKYVLPKYQ